MMSGWMKLHRSTLDWEWYGDTNTTRVWLHLLLTANFEAKRYMGHDVPAGASVHGRDELAETLGISVRNVRTALERLKDGQQVTINPCAKFSIITITNWAEYQEDDRKTTNIRPASDQQATTPKEPKNSFSNEKESNRVNLPYSELPKLWGEWTVAEMGWQRQQIMDTWLLFRDYWTEGKGKKTKRDKAGWLACWRTWCRKDAPAKKPFAGAAKGFPKPEGRYSEKRSNVKVITA
jgi:hypothetical protein